MELISVLQNVLLQRISLQAGQWGFIEYRPPKKTPNIDQISTTQHFIDQISTTKVPLKACIYTFCDTILLPRRYMLNKVLVDIFIFLHLMAE